MNEYLTINGYNFILNHVKNAKTTLVKAVIFTGNIHEKKDNMGISHLLEHVLMDSWKKCKGDCSINYWRKRGVLTNASTDQCNVIYWVEGLNKFLDEMIEFATTIVINPIMSAKRIEKEKVAVKNELLIFKNDNQYKLFNKLNSILFTKEGLVYQDNMDMQIRNLDSINIKTLDTWIKRIYTPKNILFSITGNINKRQIVNCIKKCCKPVKYNIPLHLPCKIFKPGSEIHYIKNMSRENTGILFAFFSDLNITNENYFYKFLLKFALNNSITSTLMYELREKRQLIYNVHYFDYLFTDSSYFILDISCENKNTAKVINLTLKTIKNLKKIITNGYLNDLKLSFLTKFNSDCVNNKFLSSFYEKQYIMQYFLPKPIRILSPDNAKNMIVNINKKKFDMYLDNVIDFSKIKIVYEGTNKISKPNLLL